MIKSEELSSKQMSLAVQGYGLLASPCRKLLSAEDVKFMCAEMISRCDHIFLRYFLIKLFYVACFVSKARLVRNIKIVLNFRSAGLGPAL